MAKNLETLLKSKKIDTKVGQVTLDVLLNTADVKPIKLELDVEIGEGIKKLQTELNKAKKATEDFKRDYVKTVKGINQASKNAIKDIAPTQDLKQVQKAMKDIKRDLKNEFGDGLIDTKIVRDTEQNAQKIEATIKKTTGEVFKQFYELNKDTQGFEFISQVDVDKMETNTDKMRKSLQSFKKDVDLVQHVLKEGSEASKMFDGLSNAKFIDSADVNKFKELLKTEKQMVVQGAKIEDMHNKIKNSLKNINPVSKKVISQLKEMDRQLDNMSIEKLDDASKKFKQLEIQAKNEEKAFKTRTKLLKELKHSQEAVVELSDKYSKRTNSKELEKFNRELRELKTNLLNTKDLTGFKKLERSIGLLSGKIKSMKNESILKGSDKDFNRMAREAEKVVESLKELGVYSNDMQADRAIKRMNEELQKGTNHADKYLSKLKEIENDFKNNQKAILNDNVLMGRGENKLKENIFNASSRKNTDDLRTYISELEKAEVKTIAVTQKLNKHGKVINQITATMAGKGTTVKKYTYEIEKAGQSTDAVLRKTKEAIVNNENKALGLREQIEIAMKRVPAYIVSVQTLMKAFQGLKNVGREIAEINKQMMELKRVARADLNMNKMLSGAISQSKQLGVNVHETLGALGEFARTFGDFSENQLLAVTKTATVMANVSDLSLAESSQSLIGTMNAFNIEAEDSVRIVDSLNEVDNNYAVSTQQLASGLSKASATAKVFGFDMEDLVGHITAVSSVTMESGDVIGNSLKTIYSRISTTKSARKALSELGFQLDEMTEKGKQARSVKDILGDIASRWDTLSDSERQHLGVQLAGKHQLSRFIALMTNWDTAMKATNTALHSQGSALKEQAVYMKSYEAKVNVLKTRFTELSLEIGKAFLSDGMYAGLRLLGDMTQGGINLVKSFGALPTVMTVALGLMTSFAKSSSGLSTMNPFKLMNVGAELFIDKLKGISKYGRTVKTEFASSTKFFKKFTDQMKQGNGITTSFKNSLGGIRGGLKLSTLAVGELAVGIGAMMAQMAAIVAVGYAVGKLVEHFTKAKNKAKELKEQLKQNQETQIEEFNKLGNSFDELIDKYEKFNNKAKNGTLDSSELAEYEELQQQLAKVMPNAVQYIDANGKAHLRNTKAIKKEAEATKKLVQEKIIMQQEERKAQINEKAVGIKSLLKDINGVTKAKQQLAQAEKNLNEAQHSHRSNKNSMVAGKKSVVAKRIEELSDVEIKAQSSMSALSMLLSDSANVTSEFTKATLTLNGSMKNVSNTGLSVVDRFTRVNQVTADNVKSAEDFKKKQEELQVKTDAFGKSLTEVYDEFSNMGADGDKAKNIFDTIVGSLDDSVLADGGKKAIDQYKSIVSSLKDSINNEDFDIDSFKDKLMASGMDSNEAKKIIKEIGVSFENQAIKTKMATGELETYTNSLDDMTESAKTAIDVQQELLGIGKQESDAILSRFKALQGFKNLYGEDYLANDRSKKFIEELSVSTGIASEEIVKNLDTIPEAYEKITSLGDTGLADMAQMSSEEFAEATKGMSESARNMMSDVIRIMGEYKTSFPDALRSLFTEDTAKVLDELTESIKVKINEATKLDVQEGKGSFIGTLQSSLKSVNEEISLTKDEFGQLKLSLADGSKSTALDLLNEGIDTFGLKLRENGFDENGVKLIEVETPDGHWIPISQIEQDYENSAYMLEKLKKSFSEIGEGNIDFNNSQWATSISNMLSEIEKKINITKDETGKFKAVFEDGSSSPFLDLLSNQLTSLGGELTTAKDKYGNLIYTLTQENGETVIFKDITSGAEEATQKLDTVKEKHEEVKNELEKPIIPKVEVNTSSIEEANKDVEEFKQNANGTPAKVETVVSVNQESKEQTKEELKNVVDEEKVQNVKIQIDDANGSIDNLKGRLEEIYSHIERVENLANHANTLIGNVTSKSMSVQALGDLLGNIASKAREAKDNLQELLGATSQGSNLDLSINIGNLEGAFNKIDELQGKINQLKATSSNVNLAINVRARADFTTLFTSIQVNFEKAKSHMRLGMIALQSITNSGSIKIGQSYNVQLLVTKTIDLKAKLVENFLGIQSEITTSMSKASQAMENSFKTHGNAIVGFSSSLGSRISNGIYGSMGAVNNAMSSLARGMYISFENSLRSYSFRSIVQSQMSSMRFSGESSTGSSGESSFSTSDGTTTESSASTSGSGIQQMKLHTDSIANLIQPAFHISDEKEKLADVYERDIVGLQINLTESFITKANNALKLLVKTSVEYRTQLKYINNLNTKLISQENDKLQTTVRRQKQIAQELESLKNIGSHTKEQRDNYNDLQKEFDENTKEIWKLEESIQSLNQTIVKTELDMYLDYINEIVKKWDTLTETITRRRDTFKYQSEVLKYTNPNDLGSQLEFKVKEAQQQRIYYNTLRNQFNDIKDIYEHLLDTNAPTEKLEKVYEEMIKTEKALQQEHLNTLRLEQSIKKEREDIGSKNISNLKEYYKLMEDLSIKALNTQKNNAKKAYDEKIKYYDAEIKKINEVYDVKMKEFNRKNDQEEYYKNINEKNKERLELMKEIASLSKDDSLSGKKRLSELQEKLKKSNEEINDLQKRRQDDLYKQSLLDQKEKQLNELNSKKEKEKEKQESNNKQHEIKEKAIRDMYKKIINDEKRWTEIESQFNSGNNSAIMDLLNDMQYELSNMMSGDLSNVEGFNDLTEKEQQQLIEDSLIDVSNIFTKISDDIAKIRDVDFKDILTQIKDSPTGGLSVSRPVYIKPEPTPPPYPSHTLQPEVVPTPPKQNISKPSNESKENNSVKAYHTIVSGDTLWDLAIKYYGDPLKWKKIQKANGGLNPYALQIGMKLAIPFRSGGYTGDWQGTGGKLALLHKKELVLNKNQTRDILDTVKVLDNLKRNSGKILSNIINNSSVNKGDLVIKEMNLEFKQFKGRKEDTERIAKDILDKVNKLR